MNINVIYVESELEKTQRKVSGENKLLTERQKYELEMKVQEKTKTVGKKNNETNSNKEIKGGPAMIAQTITSLNSNRELEMTVPIN